ncbi:MAG: membrane protein insertase YidC, partial [Paludibacteraceae bacterium]|nr:membrane protein insertase YidC [Paludibacteraceae bacterium]
MDKNTITGLVLIGLVLIGFSWYNSPTQEQIEERKRYYDSIQSAQIEQKAALEAEQAELNKPLFETSDTDSAKMAKAIYMYGDFAEGALGDVQNVVLENNVAKVTFSSKGAVVESVVLKDYQNYKKEPLTLFEKGDSWFSIELPTNSNRSLQTADMNFKIAAKTDSSVVFSLPVA